jgi:hypothetical protein
VEGCVMNLDTLGIIRPSSRDQEASFKKSEAESNMKVENWRQPHEQYITQQTFWFITFKIHRFILPCSRKYRELLLDQEADHVGAKADLLTRFQLIRDLKLRIQKFMK